MRIISLLPSATEIVAQLGLLDSLVGVSHNCDWPESVQEIESLSVFTVEQNMSSREIDQHVKKQEHSGRSVYHLDQERMQELDPDLIFTQELCDVCAPAYDDVQEAVRIEEGRPKIVSLEPSNLTEILDTIRTAGELTNRKDKSAKLIENLREKKQSLETSIQKQDKFERVLSLEWLDPFYGGGHWVPEMIQVTGGIPYMNPGEHSREIELDNILQFNPEKIVFLPCGMNLRETLSELQNCKNVTRLRKTDAWRAGELYATNGSFYFNRPGPRIFDGLGILGNIINKNEPKEASLPPNSLQRLKGSEFANGNE